MSLTAIGRAWRVLGAPGHPAGVLDALHHPVQRHRARPALGLPVLRAGRGTHRTRPPVAADGARRRGHGAGPVLAWAINEPPWHRSTLVIGIVSAMVLVWTVVLAWPGPAPTWLLRGWSWSRGRRPGLDDRLRLRPHVQPGHRLGTAIGLINQGGFLASLILVLAIGLVLDWRTPGSEHRLRPGRVRLGDGVPVRPVDARPGADLALPQADPGTGAHRGPGLLGAGVDAGAPVAAPGCRPPISQRARRASRPTAIEAARRKSRRASGTVTT